jgi:prolyl-tRNA synthetase
VVEAGERLYGKLGARGIEVALDDREVTAGVKFADADLIGYPVQLVVGKRGIDGGTVDLKARSTGQREKVPVDEGVSAAQRMLAAAR